MDVVKEAVKIQDGVADELTRAMVRDVTASVGGVEGSAECGERIWREQEVIRVAAFAEGVDVRMLHQQHYVGERLRWIASFRCDDPSLNFLLKRPCAWVGEVPEMAYGDALGHSLGRPVGSRR